MRNKASKKRMVEVFGTLMFSWGGDRPPEAVWAANELLEWIEKEYKINVGQYFEEDPVNSHDFDEMVIDKLEKALGI